MLLLFFILLCIFASKMGISVFQQLKTIIPNIVTREEYLPVESGYDLYGEIKSTTSSFQLISISYFNNLH